MAYFLRFTDTANEDLKEGSLLTFLGNPIVLIFVLF